MFIIAVKYVYIYQVTSQSFVIQHTYNAHPCRRMTCSHGSWNGLKKILLKGVMLSVCNNRRTCLLPSHFRALEAESPILNLLTIFNFSCVTIVLTCRLNVY